MIIKDQSKSPEPLDREFLSGRNNASQKVGPPKVAEDLW